MAWCLVGDKPLCEPVLAYCQLNTWEHFNRNLNIFSQENAFENVVGEIAVILSRPQCADKA